jgi:hypothetical protein
MRASIATMVLCSAAGWALLGASMAHASSTEGLATQATKRHKTSKPKSDKGYGETLQERERRLLRECKGRPNAGACEGYVR